MLSIVMAALRARRSSVVASRGDRRAVPVPLMRVGAVDAIAALAIGFAAAGPACMAAFGRGHAANGVIVAAATTVVVIFFASWAIFLLGGVHRSAPDAPDARPPRWGHGFPRELGAGAVGATGGLIIAAGIASTAPMDLAPITIGLGITAAAVAVVACRAGSTLGHRRATRLRTATGVGEATDRRQVPRWLVAAVVLTALAAVARHAGPVGADLVSYIVGAAVAFVAAGILRPVARWIGWRAVRVTESASDERPYVTVDGGASIVSDAAASESAGANDAVDTLPADAPRTGRFVRGTIAATGYLARRPGLDQVVALAVAGIVIAGAATLAWTSGVTARHDRAAIELGADRVLTVAPMLPARLVADVRAADPTGRHAMAVVVTSATPGGGAVVAVDAERLGAVVSGDVRSGPTGTHLAALLRDGGGPTAAIAGPEDAAGQSYDLLLAEAEALRITRLGSPVPGVPAGGILVDLRDGAPMDSEAKSEVWLAPDAPPSLVDDLSRQGLRIVADTSIRARTAVYADQPTVAVARFELLAGIVMLCCAALLIGAVTRAHRGARTVARGFGLAVAVWTAGVIGALVARHAGPDFATGFADGWARVPPPPLVEATPFGVFALVSGLVLAVAVAAVGAGRRPRSGVVNPPGPARPLDGRVGAGGQDRTDLAVGGAHGAVSAT